jgi:integrase
VKACWSWASDKEREPGPILQTNPFEGVGGPESEEAAERYVDEVQGHALLKFIEDRAEQFDPVSLTGQFERLTALLYRILYESGCRPSELVKAEWSEFSPEARVISLPRQRHKTGKKTKRPRRIPLQAHAVEALLRWRERPGRHPTRIFTHKRGRGSERRGATDPAAGEPWKVGPLGQKFRKLRNAAKKAGLDVCVRDGAGQIPTAKPEITLYDFRRTFTTDAREAGIDAGDAASAQGHRRETADKTYDVPRVQRIVGVSDRVAEKRGRALKGKEQDQEG